MTPSFFYFVHYGVNVLDAVVVAVDDNGKLLTAFAFGVSETSVNHHGKSLSFHYISFYAVQICIADLQLDQPNKANAFRVSPVCTVM